MRTEFGRMVSYAQNREDVFLERIFKGQLSGFYVDCGANDPVADSVTKHFYDKGWHGVNIEPGPAFSRLPERRPRDVNLNVAASDRDGIVTLYECHEFPTLSSLRPGNAPIPNATVQPRSVESRTLRSILAEHAPATIDFMSIDVEGNEKAVILGNDWSRFRPRVILIEAIVPHTNVPCHEAWEALLLEARYRFAFFDGVNRWYVREEDAALAERMRTPVNVLDGYVPADDEPTRRDLAACREVVARWEERTAGAGDRALLIGLWIARWIHRLASILRGRRP